MSDVALHSGVSVATVSHVVNSSRPVTAETKARVLNAIAELGYVPNAAARQLKTGMGEAVGLVVHDLGNPYFTNLARGAERRLRGYGGSLIVGSTNSDPEVERRLLSRMVSQTIRGLILTPSVSTVDNVRQFAHLGHHVVLMTDVWDDDEYSTVGLDDTLGGELAVKHLVDRGRRKLLMINGRQGLRHCEARWAGAQQAVTGVDDVSLTVVWDPGDQQSRAAWIESVLRATDLVDGIFCVNDMTALTTLKTLRGLGIRVPDEVAIIGYDDLDFASELMIPLTTVRQPTYEMGRAAMDVLLSGIVQHVNFAPQLVVRESA